MLPVILVDGGLEPLEDVGEEAPPPRGRRRGRALVILGVGFHVLPAVINDEHLGRGAPVRQSLEALPDALAMNLEIEGVPRAPPEPVEDGGGDLVLECAEGAQARRREVEGALERGVRVTAARDEGHVDLAVDGHKVAPALDRGGEQPAPAPRQRRAIASIDQRDDGGVGKALAVLTRELHEDELRLLGEAVRRGSPPGGHPPEAHPAEREDLDARGEAGHLCGEGGAEVPRLRELELEDPLLGEGEVLAVDDGEHAVGAHDLGLLEPHWAGDGVGKGVGGDRPQGGEARADRGRARGQGHADGERQHRAALEPCGLHQHLGPPQRGPDLGHEARPHRRAWPGRLSESRARGPFRGVCQ
mmetsp:Transcript_27847/g.68842  ORF Transcript_27847/g.68842 Transcript_27847/m.68842 type:complete len:359 (+) Transcript_27847:2509-3585(+)